MPVTGGAVASFNGRSGAVTPTATDYLAVAQGGLTGATQATRFVGGTASGHPTTGSFAAGDFIIDQTGAIWICTVPGTPGTWVNASAGGGGGAGVSTFNTRSGAVTLLSADVTAALGYSPVTPPNPPVTKSANYQMAALDSLVVCTGSPTITLPAAPAAGLYGVMNASGTTTVLPGAGVLNGTSVLSSANQVALYAFDGTNWEYVAGSVVSVSPIETVNVVAASGTAYTIPDVTVATMHRVTLTGNCTFTMPAAAAGKSFTVILAQDATGGRTATFTGVKWPGGTQPTITTTATTGRDMLTFVCGDGTTWLGSYQQAFA